jgi:hypothetical protein
MVMARQQSLFDEIELDEQQRNRAIERLESNLERVGVSPLQRAVISLIAAHCDRLCRGDTVSLTIPTGEAADWLVEFSPSARRLRCGTSNILRALRVWESRGILKLEVIASGREARLLIVLSQNRFNVWLDSQPTSEQLADYFASQLPPLPNVTDRDRPLPTVTHRDPPLPTVTDRDPSMNERMNEDLHSFDQDRSQPTQHKSTAQPSDLLRTLPDLPSGVWNSINDHALWNLIRAWWEEHCLAERLGPAAEAVGTALVGLIRVARKKNNPAGYFARARDRPAPYLGDLGRDWLLRLHRKAPAPAPAHDSG